MARADTDHGYFLRNMKTDGKDRAKAKQRPNRKRKKKMRDGRVTDNTKLVEALRTESRYKDKATLEIMDLCMEAAGCIEALTAQLADLQGRYDKLNDFEQTQCAKLLAKLAAVERKLIISETCRACIYDGEPKKDGLS